MTTIHLPLVLALLFVTCTLYAFILSTPAGRRFTADKTWVTVVLGVALVLGALALVWWLAALMAALFFAVGGLPIVAWKLIDEHREKEAIALHAMRKTE